MIDWESGILPALRSVLANHGQSLPDAAILELYGEFEAEAESGPYQSYRDVLQSVVRGHSPIVSSSRPVRPKSARCTSPSLHGRHFPIRSPRCASSRQRYKLVVISNIDDDLFAETRKHLNVEFEDVITAQQAGSYKPSLNNFELALRRLALSPDRLLHAAQSVYHDVVPARSLGISTVWVNRKSARPGIGAVRAPAGPASEKLPDLEVPDLASLAAAVLKPLQD